MNRVKIWVSASLTTALAIACGDSTSNGVKDGGGTVTDARSPDSSSSTTDSGAVTGGCALFGGAGSCGKGMTCCGMLGLGGGGGLGGLGGGGAGAGLALPMGSCVPSG